MPVVDTEWEKLLAYPSVLEKVGFMFLLLWETLIMLRSGI